MLASPSELAPTVLPAPPADVEDAPPLVIDVFVSPGDVSVAGTLPELSPVNAAVDDVASVGKATESTVTSVVVSEDTGGVTAEATTVTSGGAGGGVDSGTVVGVSTGFVVIGAVVAPELTFESDVDEEMLESERWRVGVAYVSDDTGADGFAASSAAATGSAGVAAAESAAVASVAALVSEDETGAEGGAGADGAGAIDGTTPIASSTTGGCGAFDVGFGRSGVRT